MTTATEIRRFTAFWNIVFELEISIRNSVSRTNERIRIASMDWIGSDPINTNEQDEKTRDEKYL